MAQSEGQSEAQSETTTAPAASSRRHRVHFSLGPILVGGGYSYFSGPAFFPFAYPYGYPFWSYYGYAPFWDPGFYGVPPYAFNLGAENGKGEVKLGVTPKTADLFIDDAFAGSAAILKGSVWLSPGAYNMCLKSPGHSDFCQRVYVLSGKKLQIVAKLAPINGPDDGPNDGPNNGKVKP